MKRNFDPKGKENKGTTAPKTLLLRRCEVEELFSMSEVLETVENAFKFKAQGKTIMPCKLYLDLPEYHGDYRAMPAYIDGGTGIKWVSRYQNNRKYG